MAIECVDSTLSCLIDDEWSCDFTCDDHIWKDWKGQLKQKDETKQIAGHAANKNRWDLCHFAHKEPTKKDQQEKKKIKRNFRHEPNETICLLPIFDLSERLRMSRCLIFDDTTDSVMLSRKSIKEESSD